jgi:multidrug efflux system membrane fusion protein
VEVAEIIQRDTPLFLEAIGNMVAFNTVDVKPRVTGQLIKIQFKEGDFVEQDQDLFVIDPAPFEAKLRETEAKLNQAMVLYNQARREYVRFQTLLAEKAVSQEQFETKETEMNSRLYQVNLAQAELETAKLNLSYCFIKSPLAGKTGKVHMDNFNIANANQDKLVTIKQIKPIKASFSVPGKHLEKIRLHQAEGALLVEAFIPGENKPESGKLWLVDNIINVRTGMLMLEGTFPNPEDRLWPGLFVHIKLHLENTRNAVLAPYKAVNDGPNGQYVWVLNADQTVAMKPIKVDRRADTYVVVAEGLVPGEKVIVEGSLMLRPGATAVTREQMEVVRKSGQQGTHQQKSK